MAFIMMLSVLRHTENPCKFWLISNFLSPSFKALIPHMAAAYGFEYELVTYVWPHWLRAQKEKQRIIWGYKVRCRFCEHTDRSDALSRRALPARARPCHLRRVR